MKVIFVGPSLPDAASFAGDEAFVCPPAVQGDVLAAVRRGASVIGLIDGGFEYTAPVWHKEILYALSQNVAVLGAASMGALRAAECQLFGMIGIGRIFREYEKGATVDDADVALLHGPMEYGYKSLTVPLVNVRATLDKLESEKQLASAMRVRLEENAARIFFKERTWQSIVANCGTANIAAPRELLSLLVSNAVDQKRIDALALLEAVRTISDFPLDREITWHMNETFVSPI
ncbi:TfuA-like protein (plasmid) [Rhizobium sp. CC1099]|uniref:TfuA-like protein n=1 Tax=Rhizobium sp. CC1099 TaxID=3039160 RepID=UPI0024B168F0|nr:TfuA-like protein [Rhizobium sp. CC1099]WFU90404.1 TfuA-like protein [Rhizobium sp. CC1099]